MRASNRCTWSTNVLKMFSYKVKGRNGQHGRNFDDREKLWSCRYLKRPSKGRFTHSMPCPCHAAKGLECVFPIWFTQCGRVWFTLAMPRSCYAPTMPFFSRPRHNTAAERRPVGYLPAFGFFRLPRGVPRRLSSEAHQSQMQVASVKPNTVCHGRGKEW